MPRITVAIPSYNHEKYVAEAIQSVLDQTYQDFEIVITNDGSTDRTGEIIRQFTDPRIRLFTFEKNHGASAAMNNCIQQARGEYIAVLNSDDIFLPDKLEKQVNFLEKNPSVGAVFGYAAIVDEDGNDFTDAKHFYYSVFKQKNRTRFEWLNYFFWHGNDLCHPSVLIRNECYKKIGLYDERLAQLPDFDFWIRLCMVYEIYVIPENLIKFRIRQRELNASGNRSEPRMRSATELFLVQKNYLTITSKSDFFKIFPEAFRFENTFNIELLPFYFVMLSLERQHKHSILFWLDGLFQLLANNEKRGNLYDGYRFSISDFVRLTGKYDIFNFDTLWHKDLQLQSTTAELHATTAELHATTAELHATTAEFLAIKKTILWRISKKMYVLFDRYFPNHSYRRKQAFHIVHFLKKLACFLKSLHFLYEKHRRTPSTRLVYTVLKKRRKNLLKNIRRKYNKAAVYVSSCGNYFYDEIFELICCGLEDLGFEIKRCNEHVGFVDDVDWHIIVAAHEFFLLSGLGSVREREMPENVILITSEQEGTPWLEACRRYFVKAYALWDINYEMSIQLKRAYKYVSYLPLGYSERFRLYHEIKTLPHNYFTSFLESKVVNFSFSIFAWKDRPIDIVFFCTANERRNTFFSKNAHFFSKYRCYFIFKDLSSGPFPAGSASIPDADTIIGIIQRSKILLNVHRGTAQYFESHRIVMNGIWNKALVISEPCNEQPPYIPNRDFVVCDTSRICDRIEYFLSPEGHEDAKEIIENAYRTLTKECTMSRSLEKCIAELYHA